MKFLKIKLLVSTIIIISTLIAGYVNAGGNDFSGTIIYASGPKSLHTPEGSYKLLFICIDEYPTHLFWLRQMEAIKWGLLVRRTSFPYDKDEIPSELPPGHMAEIKDYDGYRFVNLAQRPKVKFIAEPLLRDFVDPPLDKFLYEDWLGRKKYIITSLELLKGNDGK